REFDRHLFRCRIIFEHVFDVLHYLRWIVTIQDIRTDRNDSIQVNPFDGAERGSAFYGSYRRNGYLLYLSIARITEGYFLIEQRIRIVAIRFCQPNVYFVIVFTILIG